MILLIKFWQVDADSRPAQLGPPPTSHFHVLADTPSGIQPVEAPKIKKASKEICDTSESEPEPKTEASNFGLKTDIYAEKKSKINKSSSKPWTEQETLALLEALEMYRDDWNKGKISSSFWNFCLKAESVIQRLNSIFRLFINYNF